MSGDHFICEESRSSELDCCQLSRTIAVSSERIPPLGIADVISIPPTLPKHWGTVGKLPAARKLQRYPRALLSGHWSWTTQMLGRQNILRNSTPIFNNPQAITDGDWWINTPVLSAIWWDSPEASSLLTSWVPSRTHFQPTSLISLIVQPFGEGNGTPLQYSCLENPMDGGAC